MGRPKLTVPVYRLKEDDRGLWNIVWTDPRSGKTQRRGTGERNEASARARMPDVVRLIQSPPPPALFTIGTLLDAYIAARTERDHSKSFVPGMKPLQEYFRAWAPGQLRSDKVWDDYRKWRTGQNVANAGALASKSPTKKKVKGSTAVRELNALRGALSWAKRNGYQGLRDVEVHLPESAGRARERFLSKPEFAKLLEACKETHLELFVLLSLATGARMSAVLGIKWDNVTFPGMLPGEGPTSYTKSFVDPFAIPKGQRPQLIEQISIDTGRGRYNKRRGTGIVSPSNWRLWSALVRAWGNRDSFVLNDRGTYDKVTCEFVVAYRDRKLGKVDLTDAYRRAGIAGATQHTLRHTTISWLVQAGQSYESVGLSRAFRATLDSPSQ